MSYFINNRELFCLEPDNKGLRECQLGAIWSLKSFVTNRNNEVGALISLPTGSGKTAIMMSSCFELKLKKILIIVPSKILRGQITEQFTSLSILKERVLEP